MPHDEAELFRRAEEVARNAYAPKSNFPVGAVAVTKAGNSYSGCNVENASYGLTMCAERSAIFAAVAAEGPKMRLEKVVVVCAAGGRCSPCGACRQVIIEFGRDATVVFRDGDTVRRMTAEELLPGAFYL